MITHTEPLLQFIKNAQYEAAADYPCLWDQYQRFSSSLPLKNQKILHATPLFKNVVPKLLPLIASEAEVVVSSPKNILMEKDTRLFLQELGIRCEDHIEPDEAFDLLLDCAGTYAYLNKINLGTVELTRTGENYYQNPLFPCISVDDSRIKQIENRIGTSDGLIRALKHLNYEIDHKKVLLFGYGKVGKGIYQRLVTKNAQVVPVDFVEVFEAHHFRDSFIDAEDQQSVQEFAQHSDYIITVTGVKNLIENQYEVSYLKRGATLINMGAEDEYGISFADQEILNQKAPLNFILPEPTQLKYLDATFALHNESAVSLLQKPYPKGISKPDALLEKKFLKISEKAGINLSLLE